MHLWVQRPCGRSTVGSFEEELGYVDGAEETVVGDEVPEVGGGPLMGDRTLLEKKLPGK